VFLAFFGGPRMSHEVAHHVHESPAVMTAPLIVLAPYSGGAGSRWASVCSRTAFARFLRPVLPSTSGV